MTNRSRTISRVEDRCFRALRGLFPSIDSRVDNRRPCDWTSCSIHRRLSRRLRHTERATAHSPQMSMVRRGSRVMCRFSLVRIWFCTVQMQDSARTRVEYALSVPVGLTECVSVYLRVWVAVGVCGCTTAEYRARAPGRLKSGGHCTRELALTHGRTVAAATEHTHRRMSYICRDRTWMYIEYGDVCLLWARVGEIARSQSRLSPSLSPSLVERTTLSTGAIMHVKSENCAKRCEKLRENKLSAAARFCHRSHCL